MVLTVIVGEPCRGLPRWQPPARVSARDEVRCRRRAKPPRRVRQGEHAVDPQRRRRFESPPAVVKSFSYRPDGPVYFVWRITNEVYRSAMEMISLPGPRPELGWRRRARVTAGQATHEQRLRQDSVERRRRAVHERLRHRRPPEDGRDGAAVAVGGKVISSRPGIFSIESP